MRKLTLIFMLVGITLGCGRPDLTRNKAEELVKASPKFASASFGRAMYPAELECGLREGLFAWVRPNPYGSPEIVMTPKGKTMGGEVSLTSTYSGWHYGRPLKRQFISVTGITQSPEMGESGRLAAFTWKWDTGGWPQPLKACGMAPDEAVAQARARLQLYDDGWRVEALSFD